MTPTQLRAYSAVVRCGSVKRAAAQLEVSESAVSLHIGQLRKELGDQLFSRTGAGLSFTPGGLRLASRATELLGLQDITVLEVSSAGQGRRLLRVGASSLFAEHAAPGLIELFAGRAADLDLELSVRNPGTFAAGLLDRTVDIAIGPPPVVPDPAVTCRPVMYYKIVTVTGPDHPLAGASPSARQLRDQTWLLGPSAVADAGAIRTLLRRLGVPDDRQQIFQSHTAALEEAKRGRGVAAALAFTVAQDVRKGHLVQFGCPHATLEDVWHSQILTEPGNPSAAAELARFASTPRAIQAMMRGTGVNVARFKPSVHVTLWS
ncbi:MULTISPECIES: LysR family transcriptional regulator [Actinoplanes]|uniref:LysR family transcriptional regulator n=1 Tax=Actinoplanes TaxID=1865 RepID=UPI0005F2D9E6|nr:MULTISPECIES: LysR family transcriptional regulator [Actinoplanes]GLX99805.1 LysR family transcriptional regulator [Actinoplanes sp. NBRC 101535]